MFPASHLWEHTVTVPTSHPCKMGMCGQDTHCWQGICRQAALVGWGHEGTLPMGHPCLMGTRCHGSHESPSGMGTRSHGPHESPC